MPKSRKPRRKASRKTSRKGKKCPPGCVKKTLKRSRKSLKSSRRRVSRKASRKRRSVKRKVSRKRRSVKRKVSRKRKSAKRKASRKRRSVKRKASRKKKSTKRKASRKRRSVKRKASRKRKSAKRKSRKRKSAKRKSRKRKASRKRKSAKRKSRKSNFGFFTQRMRDSMRRKYQRTKDRLGRTFKGKHYIAPHEFLPARKLPANLYPIFIHRFPRFRGRNPSESPIIFKAKPGETASTFKRRIDSLFKNYRQQMYKKNYIEARRGGYTGSMRDHIGEYKEEQAARERAAAKQANQKMARLANLKSRKRCELIHKQIQLRRAKGMSSTALDADFNRLCKGHEKLIMRNALAAKRKGAFIASAKSFKKLDKEDVARIREELDKYKRACAAKGRNFSGRKDSSGRYICYGAAKPLDRAHGLRHRLPRGVGRGEDRQQQNVGRRYLEKAAEAQWKSVPLNEKIRRCQNGKAKLAKATTAKDQKLIRLLRNDMKLKNCNHWIAQKAPTNSGSSYF